jgi:hypothetical protein
MKNTLIRRESVVDKTGNTLSGNFFIFSFGNFSTAMEGFSGDGFVPQAKSIDLMVSTITHGRYYIPDVTYYLCVVQTAGSITENLAISAGPTIDEILDGKISDDFGFNILTKVKTKLVNA